MIKSPKFSPEVRERAVRTVQERRADFPSLCGPPLSRIAPKIQVARCTGERMGRAMGLQGVLVQPRPNAHADWAHPSGRGRGQRLEATRCQRYLDRCVKLNQSAFLKPMY